MRSVEWWLFENEGCLSNEEGWILENEDRYLFDRYEGWIIENEGWIFVWPVWRLKIASHEMRSVYLKCSWKFPSISIGDWLNCSSNNKIILAFEHFRWEMGKQSSLYGLISINLQKHVHTLTSSTNSLCCQLSFDA